MGKIIFVIVRTSVPLIDDAFRKSLLIVVFSCSQTRCPFSKRGDYTFSRLLSSSAHRITALEIKNQIRNRGIYLKYFLL